MDRIVIAGKLNRLLPDPSWMTGEVKAIVGGVMAVCIVLAVALIVMGVLTLVPGLITNNMMERAFSWRRIAAALMIPLVIGAGSVAPAWGFTALGSDGMTITAQDAKDKADYKKADKVQRESLSDDISGLVEKLGKDIADRIVQPVKDGIKKAFEKGGELWNYITGGDGKGNILQKGAAGATEGLKKGAQSAMDGLSNSWDWVSGGDGKGNVLQKGLNAAGDAAGAVADQAGKAWDATSGALGSAWDSATSWF